jgi:hypothetical protein
VACPRKSTDVGMCSLTLSISTQTKSCHPAACDPAHMKRIRISLRTLLILVTAVALILGYGQARRREILKDCSELKAYGYRFDVPNSFRDFVWQRKPVVGVIKILGGKEVLTGITLDWKGQQISSTTDARDIEIVKKLGMCEFKEYE